jgi:hypothetical protein
LIDEAYGGVRGKDSWGWGTSECHYHPDHKPPEFELLDFKLKILS